MKILQTLQYLDYLKNLFSKNVLSFTKYFELDFIFNSNAIENNTLTLSEVTALLRENICLGRKHIKEYTETKNHKDAFDFTQQLIINNGPLNSFNLKNIHYLLLKNIDQNNAGNFRQHNVRISRTNYIPPIFSIVPAEINNLLNWYNSDNKQHIILKAIKLHTEFVKIHPFTDGNGRTARLLLNFVLMKNNFLPVIIKKQQQSEYYDSLETVDFHNDYTQLNNLVITNLLESYELVKNFV